MKKRKTKKSVIKRFRVTKNGKVLHRSHNLRHLRSSKSNGQIRRLKQVKSLFNSIAIKVKKVLGK
ncbi:MAG: bL35 family ribosomal protein [Patescibacteria group bacterium]